MFCWFPPSKNTARLLGVNVPPVAKWPCRCKSPPIAVDRVNVPLLVTLPRTVSGCVIAGEPLRFIVEPLSIVSVPADWKNTFAEPLGRSRLVLLLNCTLLGYPAPLVTLGSHSPLRPYELFTLYLRS